jgi:hypothetical protein
MSAFALDQAILDLRTTHGLVKHENNDFISAAQRSTSFGRAIARKHHRPDAAVLGSRQLSWIEFEDGSCRNKRPETPRPG